MLILTRKPKPGADTIEIGQDVVVTVLDVVGTSVRIGVDAPQATKIMRRELRERSDAAAAAALAAQQTTEANGNH